MTIPITNPLHLYRSLLRETTYLFDKNARNWTHNYVKSSFRRHAAKTYDGKRWQVVPYNPGAVPTLEERHQLKRGRKFLVLVQRANQGYQRQLRTLLQCVYGRKGSRKRHLMAAVMRPKPQLASGAAGAIDGQQAVPNSPSKLSTKFTRDWSAPDGFTSLLIAQNQLSEYLNVRKTIRIRALIPEKNKWGRPMPFKRVKNINKRWYAKMAAAMMPPLPEAEWDTIRAIALRKEELQMIPRRPQARITSQREQMHYAEVAANTVVPGVQKWTSRKLFMSTRSPHKITPRFLSRFYARHILNHSPTVSPDPESIGLVTKWDDARRDVVPAAKPKDSSQTNALFG